MKRYNRLAYKHKKKRLEELYLQGSLIKKGTTCFPTLHSKTIKKDGTAFDEKINRNQRS